MILTHRFGTLPDWGREQLAKANMDQLDRWAGRVLDTDSIQALLAEWFSGITAENLKGWAESRKYINGEIIMDAVTTYQASQNLDLLIDRVIANAEPTILCNDKGSRAVLMGLDEFNSWQETLYLLSNPANAEHLRKSIREAAESRVTERELTET